MAESLPSADIGWSMSYRRVSPSAGYQLRKPPLSVGCNPYMVACLTTNGPDYQGKLHVTPYMGPEPIDMLMDEVMRMLEPEFPVAEFMSNAI